MIFKLPEGWSAVPLSEIAHEVQERNPNEPDIPVLSVTKYDGFVLSLEYFKKQIFSKDTSNYKLVRKGQFAYATIHLDEGSIDLLDKFDCGLISPMYTVFEPDSKKVDLNYLRYQMKSGRFIQMYACLGQGSINRRKSISFNTLGTITIPLPPITEQQKITVILSSVDEAIASTQAVIDQTRKVKQGLLQQLFTRGIGHTKFKESAIGKIPETWGVVSLGDAGSWQSGGTPSRTNKAYWNGCIPWVSAKDMKCEKLSDTIEHITELGAANGTRLVAKGTILVVVRGMILAHSFPVAVTLRKVGFNQDIKALLPSNHFIPEFILYWLQYRKPIILDLVDEATHGTKRLPQEALISLPIPLPPQKEQEKIVEVFSSIEESLHSYKFKLKELALIKRGLMQNLLTGKVRVGCTS
jgi:restriction endonuclease S subunit